MKERKNVLVCPLNWGLGHATRDVPIINKLIAHNYNVIIAASGFVYKFLKEEFPDLQIFKLPGYHVRYSKSNTQTMKMLLLIPWILYWTIKEHIMLSRLIKTYKIHIVVSDNRFGLWNKSTYSIFITHQLRVLFPGILNVFEPLYQWFSNQIINKFNECWIPDFKGALNLSGKLSHHKNKNNSHYFIGPLSRFENLDLNNNKDIDILIILSGPEPQRGILEKIIYDQTKNIEVKCVVVRGTNEEREYSFTFPTFDIVHTQELQNLYFRANIILCRSGYSSIMDLVKLKKKAILIPTPGQTEQEYLAKYLSNKGWFYSVNQDEFLLKRDIQRVINFPEIQIIENNELEKRILKLKEI